MNHLKRILIGAAILIGFAVSVAVLPLMPAWLQMVVLAAAMVLLVLMVCHYVGTYFSKRFKK
jgi:hypothetical protein